MRISVGSGENLKKFLIDHGTTADSKELAHRMSLFTRENVTESNLKRRLDRWFKKQELSVEVNNFRELLIAAGVVFSSYPFSNEVREMLKLDVEHEITGNWHIYHYSDGRVESYWDIKPDTMFMQYDVMEIWQEDNWGLRCSIYQRDTDPSIYPSCYYHGKVRVLDTHISFELVSNERDKEWIYKMANRPLYKSHLVGVEIAYSCRYLLRSRIWIAEREKISLSDAEVKLKEAMKDFRHLEMYGIVGYSKVPPPADGQTESDETSQ